MYSTMCKNGAALFDLDVGEAWQCELDEAGFNQLRDWTLYALGKPRPLSQMNYHLTRAADPRVEIGKGLLNASPIRVSSAATVPTKQHKSGLTAKNLPLDLTPVVHGPPVPAGT